MVRITEQLIRKKSEHNELIIGTLEELSLHQEDIERIEYLQNWCKNLKILLLQSNLISKIENIQKLKRLEYLNLSVNNIERIENVEQLESLQKLDLTLNFIGELTTSIESLRDCYNLQELILTGNPCADYEHYRDYIIVTLPQLKQLDCVEITQTIRLLAQKNYQEKRAKIVQQQFEYQIKRDEQKIRIAEQRENEEFENQGASDDVINERFWQRKSEHCPETRCEISRQHRKVKKLDVDDKITKLEPKLPRFFAECGRPYNINQAKIDFSLIDEPDRYELDLHVYKYLDTSLLTVDVQPNYIRVGIKKKIFQIALTDEVNVTESTSKRSGCTGHLLIVAPKLNVNEGYVPLQCKKSITPNPKTNNQKNHLVNYKNIVLKNDCCQNDEDIPSLI